MNNGYNVVRNQQGASLVEFAIIGLMIVLVGLFTLQIGLLYHGKITLNYAVFEAARTGAVNNASMSAMRNELGRRLAPLEGGDGSSGKAIAAVAKSSLRVNDPVNTRIVILNPTYAAFTDWAIQDSESGKRIIPVNHLRHQEYTIGRQSGLSVRDATLLKVQVTHGLDLRVPVVDKLMTVPMKWIDPVNAAFYLRGKWPLQSVATVRMQSDVLEEEILKTASSPSGSGTGTGTGTGNDSVAGNSSGDSGDQPIGSLEPMPGNDVAGSEITGGQESGPLTGAGPGQDQANTSLPCLPVTDHIQRLAQHDDNYTESYGDAVLAQPARTRPSRSISDQDKLIGTSEFRNQIMNKG